VAATVVAAAAIGIFFTSWRFGPAVIAAAATTVAATLYLLIGLRLRTVGPRWLAGTAVFYVAFGVALASGAAQS